MAKQRGKQESKNKVQKKANFKLRRSVRRTFGALFMITAILVAAIPFPDAQATTVPGQGTTTPALPTPSYEPTNNQDTNINQNIDLTNGGKPGVSTYGDNTHSIKTERAYTLLYMDNNWYYEWQFEFYPVQGTQAIINYYNRSYRTPEIKLLQTINTGYNFLEGNIFDDYYSTGDGIQDIIINETNYEDYFNAKYFPTECANIKKQIDDIAAGTVTGTVQPITVRPSNLNESMRLEYYCEKVYNNGDLQGKGYTLQLALADASISEQDTTLGLTQPYYEIYIPKKTNATAVPQGYSEDKNGFLYQSTNSYILKGIGERAFYNVDNVESIEMSEQIEYIGNSAFEDASLVQEIVLGNVREIGNNAFKKCTELHTVALHNPLETIGTEAFAETKLTGVIFPGTIKKIGYGAFANTGGLSTIDFENASGVEIGAYAFYNCPSLASQNFLDDNITAIGEGAFALGMLDNGTCTSFVFPKNLEAKTSTGTITNPSWREFGDCILAGRTGLLEVTMPAALGRSPTINVQLPRGTFQGCSNLNTVIFPETCVNVGYTSDIYSQVNNKDFYVRGPALKAAGQQTPAEPRKSTWECKISNGTEVPYMYELDGVTYYEVKSDSYLLSLITDDATKTAIVGQCTVVPGTTSTGELTIRDKIGNYEIVALGDGCITSDVKTGDAQGVGALTKLTIGDSITKIGDSVFEGSSKLSTVSLGNGVESIGSRAFANCPELASMTIGSGVTSIGAGAFEDCRTLTSIKIAAPVGGAASFPASNIGERAFCTNSDRLVIEGLMEEEYGPFDWCMTGSNYANSGLGIYPLYKSPDPYELGKNTANKISPSIYAIYDAATGLATVIHYPHYNDLKGIIAEATSGSASTAKNLCDAYEEGNIELTPAELSVINAALHVEFPKGTYSMDVSGYMNATENQMNVSAYMEGTNAVPEIKPYAATYRDYGLFNGNYGTSTEGDEYDSTDPDNDLYEKISRGNDFVESVTLHTIQSLPNTPDLTFTDVADRIKSGAFYSCEKLRSVTLGSGMQDVGTAPFVGCYALENVDCTDNAAFSCNNKILYGNNADGSSKLIQVLGSRGRDGDNIINTASDPTLTTVNEIVEGGMMDCPYLYTIDLTGADQIREIPDDGIRASSTNYLEVILPANVREAGHRAFGDMDTVQVSIYGREFSLASDAFENTVTPIVWAYEDSAAWNTVKRMGITPRPLGQTYQVQFLDFDGEKLTALTPVQHVEAGDDAEPPETDPVRPGYTFNGWDKSYKDIMEDTQIYATWSLNAQDPYWQTHFPGGVSGNGTGNGTGTDPGGTGGTGTGPGGATGGEYDAAGNRLFTLTVQNGTGGGKYAAGTRVNIQANAAPSGSGFANWSSNNSNLMFEDSTKAQTTVVMPNGDATVTANFTGYYTLTVVYGSGTGLYPAGAKVDISAVAAPAGRAFASWRLDSSGVTVENARSMSTKATMPAKNATVTATYYDTGSISGNRLNTSTTGGGNKGTQVLITKPGISDTNVASASVSGSTDSFIVKISESAEATEAVRAALQGEFSDLTWIKYFAMDITLWDATGTRQITDTTGLSIHITMPLPDALREYAGNNKMGAVVDTNKLEKLGVKFVTIDGVPCVSFTATHFSPYTIYADTANLTAGTLDATPKTGDGIHPKWFLSLGLASISMILFLKKDKKLRTGTA